MKNYSFENYYFNNSDVKGVRTEINFSKKNSFKIILHEETQNYYETTKDIEIVKEFPPLLFSVNVNPKEILSLKSFDEINELTLLDGHHRFEHLNLYSYDLAVPIVLISNNDVRVESYNSIINVSEKQLNDILIENEFKLSSSPDFFIYFQNKKYSNNEITSVYDLYDFKRKLISSEIITPIQNDMRADENKILNFTPLKLSDFKKENYLFPPKSTWISPRI